MSFITVRPAALLGLVLFSGAGCSTCSGESHETSERNGDAGTQSSAQSRPASRPDRPEITAEVEEGGLLDLVFALTSQRVRRGGSDFSAEGLHHGQRVAFTVFIPDGWRSGRLGELGPKVDSVQVTFRSEGPPSDAFVQALDEIYATKLGVRQMLGDRVFTAVSLEGEPSMPERGPIKFKLFYESSDEDRYAELFLNIDASARRLYLVEKDADYRRAVVQALAE